MAAELDELMAKAGQARREKKLAEAKGLWTDAVGMARQGKRIALIQCLRGLAQIECDLDHGTEALPLYEEAVKLSREECDPLLLAHTVRHLGDIHRRAGSWDKAEPCYEEALQLYRGNKSTAPLDLANAVRPMAILKEKTGETVQAKSLWEEARGLYESASVTEGVVECRKHLAELARAAQ